MELQPCHVSHVASDKVLTLLNCRRSRGWARGGYLQGLMGQKFKSRFPVTVVGQTE